MYAAFSEHAHNAELPRDDVSAGESLLCFFLSSLEFTLL